MSRVRSTRWLAVVALLVPAMPTAASAQEAEEVGCVVLCTPELDFEPTLTVENLFASPRVEHVASGAITRLERELAFNWLPPQQWLRNVGVEASFDYLATGLPRRGDVVKGRRFLDDASAWSLSFVLVVPVAPLSR